MAEGAPTRRNERRDVAMFLGFVVIVVAISVTVVLASRVWTSATWGKIGDVGSFGQFVAVLGALGVA